MARSVKDPSLTLDTPQTEFLELVMNDTVDCAEEIRPSFIQLLHQVTTADSSKLKDLEYCTLPYGFLNSKAFNLLNWFPRDKMKDPVALRRCRSEGRGDQQRPRYPQDTRQAV